MTQTFSVGERPGLQGVQFSPQTLSMKLSFVIDAVERCKTFLGKYIVYMGEYVALKPLYAFQH